MAEIISSKKEDMLKWIFKKGEKIYLLTNIHKRNEDIPLVIGIRNAMEIVQHCFEKSTRLPFAG